MPSRHESIVGEPRALIVPAWGYYIVFFVTPLSVIFAYAFAIRSGFFDIRFGLYATNFERLWDPVYLKIYRDTLLTAATGTIGCLLVGYPFAYWLGMRPHRHKTTLLLLIIVPFWTSILIRTYAWALILSGDGPLSGLLQGVHAIGEPLGILHTSRAVLVGLVYDYLPLMLFPLYVSIDRLDRRLVEASRDLGLGRARTFRRVTLPLTLPGILTGSLLVFVPMTGEYVVPTILGGGKSALFGPIVASQFLVAIDYPFGAAMSVALVVVLLAAIFGYLRVLGARAEESLGAAL